MLITVESGMINVTFPYEVQFWAIQYCTTSAGWGSSECDTLASSGWTEPDNQRQASTEIGDVTGFVRVLFLNPEGGGMNGQFIQL